MGRMEDSLACSELPGIGEGQIEVCEGGCGQLQHPLERFDGLFGHVCVCECEG